MRGIDDKPFITLDQFVDLDGLLSIKTQVIRALSSSCYKFLPGTAGTGKNKLDNSLPDMAAFDKTNQSLTSELEGLDLFERNYALKYMHPVTTMGHTLTLRGGTGVDNYQHKNKSGHVQRYSSDYNFDFLYSWLDRQQIFGEIGRVMFFMASPYQGSQIHSDYPALLDTNSVKDQFVWIRFDHRKEFFVYDEKTQKKHYFDGYVTYFNNIDYHGGDPSELPCFSLRIDGVFSQEFLSRVTVLKEHLQN